METARVELASETTINITVYCGLVYVISIVVTYAVQSNSARTWYVLLTLCISYRIYDNIARIYDALSPLAIRFTSARTSSYLALVMRNDLRLASCPLPCLPARTSFAITFERAFEPCEYKNNTANF